MLRFCFGRSPGWREENHRPFAGRIAGLSRRQLAISFQLIAGFSGADLHFNENYKVRVFDLDVDTAFTLAERAGFDACPVRISDGEFCQVGALQLPQQRGQDRRPLAMIAKAIEQPAQHCAVAHLVLADAGGTPGIGGHATTSVVPIGCLESRGKFIEAFVLERWRRRWRSRREASPAVEEPAHRGDVP